MSAVTINHIHIDFETYSEADITKVGAAAYAAHPSTEVICMAYSMDGDTPKLWLPGEPLPDFAINPNHYHFHAWNSFFETRIIKDVLKWPLAPISNWTDTAAQAAALALPRALEHCGAALGLAQDVQKDKRGKYLIQKLCKPNRGARIYNPELLEELYEYCLQGVIAERTISEKLRPLKKIERQVWELDQTINMRGLPIDVVAIDDALVTVEHVTELLNHDVSHITDGELDNMTQRLKVLEHFKTLDYPLETLDKGYLAEVLKDTSLPTEARELIKLRLQLSKSSTAKYKTLKRVASSDNRAYGMFMYHGASTGRWASPTVNFQNLPRTTTIDDVEACVDLFKHQNAEQFINQYPQPMSALSDCVRAMISASKGKRLIVADYSSIEARILAGLAGQMDIIDVFKGDGKVYEYTASKIFRKSIDKITPDERFIGKTATLALGYQGGPAAFMRIAKSFDIDFDPEHADVIKNEWRRANPYIVQFWYDVDNAAKGAVRNPGKVTHAGAIQFKVINNCLYCRLPSSRLLAFNQPQMHPGKFGKPQVTFMGVNAVTKKWERQAGYGGLLVENICQGIARDIMAHAMLKLEAAGYPIVMTVHDEVIAEVDADFGDVCEFEHIMCELPDWAAGLPIKAEGFECQRYRKN